MARKLIDKLKEAFIERIFSYDECLIDSLMRINDENIEYCKGCSFVWFAEKDGSCNICSHALDIDLDEVV